MAAIADSDINNIQSSIDDKKMGVLLGYEYNDAQGCWYDGGYKVNSLMNAVANTEFNNLGNLYSHLTVSDVMPERTGFLSLIDGDATLDNMGDAVTDAFNEVTLQELMDLGIINLDYATIQILDQLITDDANSNGVKDWREQKLPDSFDYIIKKLLSKIPMLP